MKILLSAFVCEPGLGSEEGVGWGTAWSLAQWHDVHVLTRPQHRAGIERQLRRTPCARLTLSYYDFPPRILRFVVTSPLWQVYYHAWQNRIAGWARPAVEAFDPDVVHHITYGRYWTPCSLWKLGRPFVWGPLGGGDSCPPKFLSTLSCFERAEEKLRSFAQALACRDPHLRATARNATVAIASTPATERCLLALGAPRVEPLLQMAISADVLQRQIARPSNGEIIFCSVSRLLGWKGHGLLLRAFARARISGAKLVIIGDGPSKARLLQLAQQLKLNSSVEFLGNLPRADALNWIDRSTALVHASLHDQAPTVIFEAMAASTPVIALALGGPTRQVSSETGFLIAADTPDQAAEDIAQAMRRVAFEPGLGEQLGRNGRQRVEQCFTWEKKAEQFCAIYGQAIQNLPTDVVPYPLEPGAASPAF